MPDVQAAEPQAPARGLAPTALVLLAALLVFAPLLRSGQVPIAQLALELLAVALLVVLFWEPKRVLVGPAQAWALAVLLVYPLLYLVPLPAALVGWLPGWDLYRPLEAVGDWIPASGATRLSLVPLETESTWLLLVPAVAVFVATRMLRADQAQRLVWLLLGVAAFQASLGLIQYGAGAGPLYLGMEHAHGNAVGTYTNRNHLAGLIEMTLPMAIALLVFSIGRRSARERANWRRRVAFFGSLRGQAAVGYAAIALLLLIGIVFTRSRGGIALTMLGILLATLAFSRRIGGTNVYGLTGTLVASAVGIAIVIGLGPVLDRFTITGTIENARWPIYSATLTGIGHFFPLGSGPGTYPDVFPAFQPIELGRWFVKHAHNDYLEWLLEGGIIAAGLILLFIVVFLAQWRRVWTPGTWSRMRFVQVAAGIGLLLLALHGLVDFNLHIPANIVYFAFLAGVFFSEPAPENQAIRSQRRRRQRSDFGEDPEPSTQPPRPRTRRQPAPPSEQIKNPFLD